MARLKSNVIANICGQAANAVLPLVFIPIYISLMGIEAYGLVGLFVVIQAWLRILDMGITPTITRECGAYLGGKITDIQLRNLFRSAETLVLLVAVAIILIVYFLSVEIATGWKGETNLATEVIVNALIAMGFVVALRYVESVYTSVLFGMQSHVLLNIFLVVFALLRSGGAVIALQWLSPTIITFFVWQVVSSALALVVAFSIGRSTLPITGTKAHFSTEEISRVLPYASGVLGLSLVALFSTQIDKIVLTRFITLEEFALYSLAFTVAGILTTSVSPIIQSFFPVFCAGVNGQNANQIVQDYKIATQLVVVISTLVLVVLGLFSFEFLKLWTGSEAIATGTAQLLVFLLVGNAIKVITLPCHSLQLASGWTSLEIKFNIFVAVGSGVALIFLIPIHGAIAAGWVWCAINALYYVFVIPKIHGNLISISCFEWFLYDVVRSGLAVVIPVFSLYYLLFSNLTGWIAVGSAVILGALGGLTGIYFSVDARNWLLRTAN